MQQGAGPQALTAMQAGLCAGGFGHLALPQVAGLLLCGALEGHCGQLLSQILQPGFRYLPRDQICKTLMCIGVATMVPDPAKAVVGGSLLIHSSQGAVSRGARSARRKCAGVATMFEIQQGHCGRLLALTLQPSRYL